MHGFLLRGMDNPSCSELWMCHEMSISILLNGLIMPPFRHTSYRYDFYVFTSCGFMSIPYQGGNTTILDDLRAFFSKSRLIHVSRWWGQTSIETPVQLYLVGFNPSEKYARQIGSFPHIGMKVNNT